MTEASKECEACFGTGNEFLMQSRYPIRKITSRPCPICRGTNKAPVERPTNK